MRRKTMALGAVTGWSLALSGCVSLGVEVPDSLLTLSSEATAPAGVDAQMDATNAASAIAIMTPEVPAKLDVLRVPVNVSQTQIAYLEDAIWVDKPARLFRKVLGETLRARDSNRPVLVLDTDDAPVLASVFIKGTLSELSYDASAREVIVRFDAFRSKGARDVVTRRFEARESVATPDAQSVGPALNRAVNTVAGEVADWVIAGS
ncbi:MAG: ABC-type transport auxiliary lipoprotein family protein [Pseudomonadota bacterium]